MNKIKYLIGLHIILQRNCLKDNQGGLLQYAYSLYFYSFSYVE